MSENHDGQQSLHVSPITAAGATESEPPTAKRQKKEDVERKRVSRACDRCKQYALDAHQ